MVNMVIFCRNRFSCDKRGSYDLQNGTLAKPELDLNDFAAEPVGFYTHKLIIKYEIVGDNKLFFVE